MNAGAPPQNGVNGGVTAGKELSLHCSQARARATRTTPWLKECGCLSRGRGRARLLQSAERPTAGTDNVPPSHHIFHAAILDAAANASQT